MVAAILTAAILLVAAYQLARGWSGIDGRDFLLYRDAAHAWLAGEPFYPAWQTSEPYEVWGRYGAILYPPVALYLFVPFTILPAVLWWAVPVGIVVWCLARLRPPVEVWPLLALCLAWPPTLVMLAHGNPVIWLVAFVALATLYGWPAVLVLLKPSLALVWFAAFGIRDRRWWLALAVFALACLPFGLLWLDWARTLTNATDVNVIRGVQEVPMLLLPVIAWAASKDDRPDARHDGRRGA